MSTDADCEQCIELLNAASAAVVRQLQVQSRLDLARYRRLRDLIPQLEASERTAELERATALMAYKSHRATHQR